MFTNEKVTKKAYRQPESKHEQEKNCRIKQLGLKLHCEGQIQILADCDN